MKHLMNQNVKDVQISGIKKVLNKVAQDPDIINLTFGQPDFPTPEYVKDAGKKALDNNQTGYTMNIGIPELRQAASNYLKQLYGLNYRAEDEIIATAGASEGLDIALRTILTPGSEVLMPAPTYYGYEPIVRLCGGKPIFIDTSQQDFKITADLIEPYITDKTRCLILSSPSNPTGTVLTEDEVNDIGDLLKDKDIFVLSDEVYSELTYDGNEHISIASIPSMKEKTIVINALSKSHAMTGWRIGFTFAPAYITEELVKVHASTAVCTNSITQVAATEALNRGMHTEEIQQMKTSYKKRRDYMYERLKQMNLKVLKPAGTFYIFPEIPDVGLTSAEFVDRMIDEAKVAAMPGTAFSPYGEGFIRISYAQSISELETAMDRMEKFLEQFNSVRNS